eukprot:c1865_g1_i1.p1 GENE.c1865_g1_i1~~c1865_g1_i1.p1  ORF type:complete len:280 (-),score=47.64 c1865_g1_i1:225-1064(-)
MELGPVLAAQQQQSKQQENSAPTFLSSSNPEVSLFLNAPHTMLKTLLIDIVFVVIYLILHGSLITAKHVPAFHRKFFLDDESISFSAPEGRISASQLYVISILCPIVIMGTFGFTLKFPRTWLMNLLSAFFRTHVFSTFSTNFLKYLVGRQRPTFLFNACIPDRHLCTGNICSAAACTTDKHTMLDGFLSFPSGHASASFAGLTFLTLFLWSISKPHITGNLVAILMCFGPLLVAAFISITRIQDYEHHWEDIVIGAVLGAGWATFFFVLALLRPASRL